MILKGMTHSLAQEMKSVSRDFILKNQSEVAHWSVKNKEDGNRMKAILGGLSKSLQETTTSLMDIV